MLNYIWLGLISFAVLAGGLGGKTAAVGDGAIASAQTAVNVVATLLAITVLWLGLMQLARRAGLVERLGLALKPVMVWLFPEVPPDHPAMGAIIMNVAANLLGLNNAATPLGLRAMAELQRLNPLPHVATHAMCMLLAINTSSITLIPVSVIALLTAAHGKNPTAIIGTSLAATAVAHVVAIGTAKLLARSRFFAAPAAESLPVEPAAAPPETETEAEAIVPLGTATGWVRGGRWLLAALGLAFLATFLLTAFPELRTWGPWSGVTLLAVPGRLINALSELAIPWLIFFFPAYAALRRIPVYEEFVEGAKEGLTIMVRIIPYVVGMFVAIGMFRASGGLDWITRALSPATALLGFPAELVPMALIRPFSGSAALAVFADLIHTYGPDDFRTLAAATFYGSSETTFYVLAVYFGSVKVTRTRYAVLAGVLADLAGPLASVWICRLAFH